MKAHITTICSVKTQAEVRNLLARYFNDLPIEEYLRNQLVLAVDEALANAIIHGNDKDPSRSVQIDINFLKDRLIVELNDCGYFDIKEDSKKEKPLTQIIKEKQKGGLGLKLIYSIMDVVSFYIKGDKSFCSMIKYIDQPQDKEA